MIDRYFELSAMIERGKAEGNLRAAVAAARATYPILSQVVLHWAREYGGFDITTSHAVHTAPTLMAVLEDREGIRELRVALEGTLELRDWLPAADQAEEDVELVAGIIASVHREPGVMQSRLKTNLGVADGHRVSQLAYWLDKAGRIRRVRKGSSYQLYPMGHRVGGASAVAHVPAGSGVLASPDVSGADAESMSSAPVVAPVLRARPRRSAFRARQIDFGVLPFVRLPKAPPYWNERLQQQREVGVDRTPATPVPAVKVRAESAAARKARPNFVVEGDGWQIIAQDKLAPDERPDPAYKQVFATAGSTFWLDTKGRRERFEDTESVLRVTDRAGAFVAERGLHHDVYRSDVNTEGSAILFMSRGGILHAYSDRIEQFVAERVEDLPEYQAQAQRLGIGPQELRTHVRCVAISADRSRYLVTIVDEAWCLSTASGEILWGLRLPTKEGWAKVVTQRADRSGTSAEVGAALRFMELELPLSPEDITHQYRKLAMRWHPDRNPDDRDATQRFQELREAMELLTGADLHGIGGGEVEEVTYEKIIGRRRVQVPVDARGGTVDFEITFSMGVSEKQAADWIYAANFASSDNRVFLAGYSGRVLEVSDQGMPVRVYDLGAVPRHILETGSRFYLLTDTRLYVLSGDRLEAFVDVFGQGQLIIGETGFGLLESKEFSWFTPIGRGLGRIRAKDPIRRVLSAPQGLVVETRQHRAVVGGAPSWWRS